MNALGFLQLSFSTTLVKVLLYLSGPHTVHQEVLLEPPNTSPLFHWTCAFPENHGEVSCPAAATTGSIAEVTMLQILHDWFFPGYLSSVILLFLSLNHPSLITLLGATIKHNFLLSLLFIMPLFLVPCCSKSRHFFLRHPLFTFLNTSL